jgi:N-acetylmuramic acid 6-phosphate etherase
VDVDVRLLVGPELLTGSVRLKTGTVANHNLYGGVVWMIQGLTDLNREDAVALLEKSDRRVKLALLIH